MSSHSCKGFDKVFKKRFGIRTSIEYLEDVKIDQKIADRFRRSWKRFCPKPKSIISMYKDKGGVSLNFFIFHVVEEFFRQLKKDGTDERYCSCVTIRHINPDVGYGVFATEDIPPYCALHHYAGILMLREDITPGYDSTFSFTDYKTYAIDGMKQGNWTRFMNHSPLGHPKTNVIPWAHYISEGPRMVFTSGQSGIKKGEQLLFSYGSTYWKDRKFSSL